MIKYNIYHKGRRINQTAISKNELERLKKQDAFKIKEAGSTVYKSYNRRECEIVECIML